MFGGRLVSGASTALEIHTSGLGGQIVQRSIITRGAAELDEYLRDLVGDVRELLVMVGPAVLTGPDVELHEYEMYSRVGEAGAFEARYVADEYSVGLTWGTRA